MGRRKPRGPDLLYLGCRAHSHALVNCVVLGVDGQQRHVSLAGVAGEDFPGGDHALFVGQTDGFPGQDGGMGRFKAGDADNGGNDEIDFRVGRTGHAARCAPKDFYAGNTGIAQPAGEFRREFFGRKRDQPRTPADGLIEGRVHVSPSDQRGYGVPFRIGINDREGALADGAGRSENSEAFQCDTVPDSMCFRANP